MKNYYKERILAFAIIVSKTTKLSQTYISVERLIALTVDDLEGNPSGGYPAECEEKAGEEIHIVPCMFPFYKVGSNGVAIEEATIGFSHVPPPDEPEPDWEKLSLQAAEQYEKRKARYSKDAAP